MHNRHGSRMLPSRALDNEIMDVNKYHNIRNHPYYDTDEYKESVENTIEN